MIVQEPRKKCKKICTLNVLLVIVRTTANKFRTHGFQLHLPNNGLKKKSEPTTVEHKEYVVYNKM